MILIDDGTPLPRYTSYFKSLSISSMDFALLSRFWMGRNTVRRHASGNLRNCARISDAFPISLSLRDFGQPGIEVAEPRLDLLDRQSIIGDHNAFGRLFPRHAINLPPMSLRPVAAAAVQPPAQEQLPQPMPASMQILPGIITGATQVADGFLFQRRRPDLRQEPPHAGTRRACGHRGDSF
jgi:hypothetical protein